MKVILSIFFIFIFNSCSFEDYFEIKNAKKQFSKMCKRESGQDLLICNNLSKDIIKYDFEFGMLSDLGIDFLKENGTLDVKDIYLYAINTYSSDKYVYKKEKSDFYYYMTVNEDDKRVGDCDDYVATFIEDVISYGLAEDITISWVFGRVGSIYHSWVKINKNNQTYIFDTYYKFGITEEKAYKNKNYRELHTLYTRSK